MSEPHPGIAIERMRYFRRTIPHDAAVQIGKRIDSFVIIGIKYPYTFPLRGEDEWCEAVVEWLLYFGYRAVSGRRMLAICECDVHRGKQLPSEFFRVTVGGTS